MVWKGGGAEYLLMLRHHRRAGQGLITLPPRQERQGSMRSSRTGCDEALEIQQVELRRLSAKARQDHVRLAAMMGLVIE
jgi:hypothetical protein